MAHNRKMLLFIGILKDITDNPAAIAYQIRPNNATEIPIN